MGIRSGLNQNFYMDTNEVIGAAERIRSVMAEVDACMWEADELFCRIADLAESVPAEARCEALISACENARTGIRKSEFLEYGNRVSRNMIELADESEYVSGETAKGMENVRERLYGIRNTAAELREVLENVTYQSTPAGIKGDMQRIMEKEDGIISDTENINKQDNSSEQEHELTTSYLAAILSGVGVDRMGQPKLGSVMEYRKYAECYEKIEAGEYENSYMAARLAGLSFDENNEAIINNAAESDLYSHYYYRLQQMKSDALMLSMEGVEILEGLELADWQLEDVGVYGGDGNLIGIMPYYVMVNNHDGTHTSDGGVTIGKGHYIWDREWANETDPDHELLSQYVPDGFELTRITVDDGKLLHKGGYLVEGADMVPIAVVDQIFYTDIQNCNQAISTFLEQKNVTVTQSQFDALVICRFNSGRLPRDIIINLENGNWNPDDWYNAWPGNRRDFCQNLFFGGDSDEDE